MRDEGEGGLHPAEESVSKVAEVAEDVGLNEVGDSVVDGKMEAWGGLLWEDGLVREAEARGFRIDHGLLRILPPPSAWEDALFEEELAQGVGGRIKVYRRKGDNTVLDGYRGLHYCLRHGIEFDAEEVELPADPQAAVDWRLNRQLARRNLTPFGHAYLLGRIYNAAKGRHGGERASGQGDHLKTAERLAGRFKVSERTVRRNGELAEWVDGIAENCGEEARRLLLSDDCDLNRDELKSLAALQPVEQMEAMDDIRGGEVPRALYTEVELPEPPADEVAAAGDDQADGPLTGAGPAGGAAAVAHNGPAGRTPAAEQSDHQAERLRMPQAIEAFTAEAPSRRPDPAAPPRRAEGKAKASVASGGRRAAPPPRPDPLRLRALVEAWDAADKPTRAEFLRMRRGAASMARRVT